jgi:hypothetical protein
MATTIQSDIRSALHMASSTFRSLSPNLIHSRAAARRALPYYSSSSSTAATTSSLILRAFSSTDSTSDAVLKVPEKPSLCTADELHYVSVSNSDWRLALWRYHPSPQVPHITFYFIFSFKVFLITFLVISFNYPKYYCE